MKNSLRDMFIIACGLIAVIAFETFWILAGGLLALSNQISVALFLFSATILLACLLREIVKAKNKAFLLENLPNNLQDELAVVIARSAIDTWYPNNAKMQQFIAHVCASAIASQKILETLVLVYHPIDAVIADIFRSRLTSNFNPSLEGFLNDFAGERADITCSPNNKILDDFLRRVDAIVVIYGSKSYDVCENIGRDAVLYMKQHYRQPEVFSGMAEICLIELYTMQDLSMDSHQRSALLTGARNELKNHISKTTESAV